MKDLILALQIFSKYENLDYPTHCEHDTLWVLIDPELVGPKDTEALDKLGFFADESDRCFKSYKYGSA
jgi:hypothetical protein|tara:strand:- start:583 stop:786 length:204 start_codon:yes stop_codon:yes gene_type:complete